MNIDMFFARVFHNKQANNQQAACLLSQQQQHKSSPERERDCAVAYAWDQRGVELTHKQEAS